MNTYRTRFLPKMLNSEVEQYLETKNLIIVPVGTVEMHGGLPLDSETVISEAFALAMAEAGDGLALSGLPYFYAGATASGRGTVQVSIRQGIDYLTAIGKSLLRQGFKRQIYLSFHGPAHMTCSPMVRDFFDETGIPILYMDLTMQMLKKGEGLFRDMNSFHAITVGAYKMLNRLDDVPLTDEFFHQKPSSVEQFQLLFDQAYQSGSIGYCFGDTKDHMSTPVIDTEEKKLALAVEGEALIRELVNRMGMKEIVGKMEELEMFQNELRKKMPWMG